MSNSPSVDPNVLARILQYARDRNTTVAALSVEEISRGIGLSRATLYRRIGSRQALLDAMRLAGHDTGEQPNATERMLEAAADLIREGGHAVLTLEAVAARAGVALPTVFARFGNRSGLLTQVFEKYGPIPRLQRHLRPLEPGDTESFRRCVTAAYGEIWDLLLAEHALVSAIAIEALRDPDGEIRHFLQERYLPEVFSRILPWLGEQIRNGTVRPIPLLILGQEFVAPMLMHMATRPLVRSAGVSPLPDRDTACAMFADLYCLSVLAPVGTRGGSS
jgi:AcrR family transcriptional regulator